MPVSDFHIQNGHGRHQFETKMFKLQRQLSTMAKEYPFLYDSVEGTNLGRWCRHVLQCFPTCPEEVASSLSVIQESIIEGLHMHEPFTIREIIDDDEYNAVPPPAPLSLQRHDGSLLSVEQANNLAEHSNFVSASLPPSHDYDLSIRHNTKWSIPMSISFVPDLDTEGELTGYRISSTHACLPLPNAPTLPDKSELSEAYAHYRAEGLTVTRSQDSTAQPSHPFGISSTDTERQGNGVVTRKSTASTSVLRSRDDADVVFPSSQPSTSATTMTSEAFTPKVISPAAASASAENTVQPVPFSATPDTSSKYKGPGKSRKRGRANTDEAEDAPTRPQTCQRIKLIADLESHDDGKESALSSSQATTSTPTTSVECDSPAIPNTNSSAVIPGSAKSTAELILSSPLLVTPIKDKSNGKSQKRSATDVDESEETGSKTRKRTKLATNDAEPSVVTSSERSLRSGRKVGAVSKQ